jgi:hypothetical protein
VAWQNPRCRRLACPLHVTSLRTGAAAVIPLPPGTQTNGQPGAFGPKDKRLALALDTISRGGLSGLTDGEKGLAK